ncbi:MAG: SPOR domain-containing protein [Nitrospinota bacterium]|nr:SPOR domain-containing protein [Nitrospinota bacterium]
MKPELVTIQKIRLIQLGAVALVVCVLSFIIGYYYHGSGDGETEAPSRVETAKEPQRGNEGPIIKLIGPDPEKREAEIGEDTEAPVTRLSPPPPKKASVPPKQPAAMKPAVEPIAAPPPTPAPKEPKASTNRKYTVQVASFQKMEDANRLMESLKKSKYPSYIKTVVIKGKRWNRVRVGSYESIEKARKVSLQIEKQNKLKTMVVRYE